MRSVRFLIKTEAYQVGETAGLDDALAEKVIATGRGVEVETPADAPVDDVRIAEDEGPVKHRHGRAHRR